LAHRINLTTAVF